jgi:hypothetical protein
MKATAMVAMAAVMGTMSWGASTGTQAERTITVCFEKSNAGETADKAEIIASKMFQDIGVTLAWHSGRRFCHTAADHVIAVSLSTHTPPSLLPSALAYALPYEGVHIEVFYDRMDNPRAGVPPSLLAHVLVHEITHIVQGINRHSASGIMKAHWERSDYSCMQTKSMTLPFTEEDVRLIYKGLDAWASYRATGALAATVQ